MKSTLVIPMNFRGVYLSVTLDLGENLPIHEEDAVIIDDEIDHFAIDSVWLNLPRRRIDLITERWEMGSSENFAAWVDRLIGRGFQVEISNHPKQDAIDALSPFTRDNGQNCGDWLRGILAKTPPRPHPVPV